MKGKYIVIEGGEGCGKTTQAKLLFNYLNNLNIPCYFGREPGGVEPAEEVRKILKNSNYKIDSVSELFGFAFARSLFFQEKVTPILEEGKNFISDRSGFSTLAYQGYAGGVPIEDIELINKIAMRNIKPDLAIIIDINPLKGLEKEIEKDRFGKKGIEYHNQVREGFLKIAKKYPEICRVINYKEKGIDTMQEQIRNHVFGLINP